MTMKESNRWHLYEPSRATGIGRNQRVGGHKEN